MIVDLFQKTRASSRRIKNPKESAHAPVTVTCKTCGREWSAQQYGKNGYVCPECGTHHDRDANAATNILRQGIASSGSLRKTKVTLLKGR